jgi:hypothetical protein
LRQGELQGETIMSGKLLWLMAAAATILDGSLTTSRAASREFCEEYARAAIIQVRGGLSNRGCIGGMEGARWSAEYRVHFDWCLGASFAAAGAERTLEPTISRRAAVSSVAMPDG